MQVVDFYFDFSSTNSYFAAFMLPEICRRHDAIVNWIPLHLGALFRETGFDVMAMTPRKARYLWHDHARYAAFTGLPFRRPSRFPIKTASALRMVLAAGKASAETRGDGETNRRVLSQALMRAYWQHDEDIADAAVLVAVASDVGFDGGALLKTADSDAIRDELRATTEEAAGRGVFGLPTFVVGGELFWGKDRLDFVERMLKQP
jgi:2-hydroxychromene-2-carboxylate isomerase